MSISETCPYILRIEIFSLEISYIYWHSCSKKCVFSILSKFCGYIDQYTFCIQISCWMTELPKCGRVVDVEIVWVKVKEINKTWTKIYWKAKKTRDKDMHLIIGNYLVKIIFHNYIKSVVNTVILSCIILEIHQ